VVPHQFRSDSLSEAIDGLSTSELGSYIRLVRLCASATPESCVGFLYRDGKPLSIRQIRLFFQRSSDRIKQILAKLESVGLLTTDDSGVYGVLGVEFGGFQVGESENPPEKPKPVEKKLQPKPKPTPEPEPEPDPPSKELKLEPDLPVEANPHRTNKTYLAGVRTQIPVTLETPEFREAWCAWLDDRAERRKPVTRRAAQMQLKKLSALRVEDAIRTIEQAIDSGWVTVYPKRFRDMEVVRNGDEVAEHCWLDECIGPDDVDYLEHRLVEMGIPFGDIAKRCKSPKPKSASELSHRQFDRVCKYLDGLK